MITNEITLDELNEKWEETFNSRSLYIVQQVLHGRKVSEKVWIELQSKHFSSLKNLVERLASGEAYTDVKKKAIDLLLEGNREGKELSVNDLGRLSEALRSSPALQRYLLDKFAEKRKRRSLNSVR